MAFGIPIGSIAPSPTTIIPAHLGAFNDVYRVLKPDTFCVSFYGWTTPIFVLSAWRRAGFVPVGHLVWQKNYASRRGFLEARHEQAYLLAKGRPAKPPRSR